MKGYWVAFVNINDKAKYQDYLALAPAALQKYGAKLLSRGEDITIIEGFNTPPDRAVVFEFESYDKALECYHSPEYQEAKKHRSDCASANILIMNGLK
ncbi:DUF1330 domain-containing protein [Marinomonas rhizomae]|uniref:Uncharacterized protein (DUF1330 family) n=1 Tax=Marinomonas rhizomae TaxID=491948 RepID=A0A366IZH8_9GAMM|nr:DUF1330 domain-containing protein [Marinomonas rhizomae]RBP79118.1 uncharacterized protein (DUF1330 family) [Marinomonas rhizomae]RNF70409.1 DUF1330 domain-containing protein [Marinomonas rhizomae]